MTVELLKAAAGAVIPRLQHPHWIIWDAERVPREWRKGVILSLYNREQRRPAQHDQLLSNHPSLRAIQSCHLYHSASDSPPTSSARWLHAGVLHHHCLLRVLWLLLKANILRWCPA